jgi:caffeoyl-CoA O-methyltransferase
MQSLLPPQVDAHLVELVKAQHLDPVLDDMERRADAYGFPIIGRAVGRFVEIQARMIAARRVVELGSGFGYSAYWFAGAVGAQGEVVCTDTDPANAALAEAYLRRAGRWDPVRYHVGDALDGLAAVDGEVDVIYCDIDKEGYPAAWAAASERLRVGGLFLCDNVLWDGRVAGLTPGRDGRGPRAAHRGGMGGASDPGSPVDDSGDDDPRAAAEERRAAVTDAIVAMTREVAQDPRYISTINPVRDGVLVALRVA